MRFCSIKIVILFLIVVSSGAGAKKFESNYVVKTTGIKIGEFNWLLSTQENKYETQIELRDSGLLSSLYSFEGKYLSNGIIVEGLFKSEKYSQFWKVKKKQKIINIGFNNNLIDIQQNPKEEEMARLDIKVLFNYFDPITSFINILSGAKEANTIDGRRIYTMKKNIGATNEKVIITIKNYKNIWADHKRNDLKKIEFELEKNYLFPKKIKIYFKNRVFNLEKN